MPSAIWEYSREAKRYRNKESGRFLSAEQMRGLRDRFLADQQEQARSLASRVASGDLSVDQWEREMRRQVKTVFLDQAMLGRGGRYAMTQSDYGLVGQQVRTQYGFLREFAGEIAGGDLSEGQITARAVMYVGAGTQAYERSRARSYDLSLDQVPGDGQTQCLCITTAHSRVLTARGLLPIAAVEPGDLVFTHRHRWRLVLAVHCHRSEPNHRQAWLTAPNGARVGCTQDHPWLTNTGWHTPICIDNHALSVYTVGYGKHMFYLRSQDGQPAHGVDLSNVCECMRVRDAQGLPGRLLPVLRNEPQSERAVGESRTAGTHSGGIARSQSSRAKAIRGSGGSILQHEKAGRSPIWLLLDGGRQEEVYLPLSVAVAESQRLHSSGQGPTSSRPKSSERRAGQSSIACPLRTHFDSYKRGDETEDVVHMSDLWGDMAGASAERSFTPVLLEGMLLPGTPLYDLTVEEDHSFVIEGLISHNSNCKCSLDIEEDDEEFRVSWQLGDADHCEDCLALAAEWSPLIIPKAAAASLSGAEAA